jgi:hemolysin III
LGWVIFSIVWGIALIGTIFKSIWGGEKFNSISTLFYVLAGWAILIDIKTVYNKLPQFGFYWLFAGGLFYTIGAFFYLKEDLPRNHEIWHFFVLGGSVCQFVSVFFYVI